MADNVRDELGEWLRANGPTGEDDLGAFGDRLTKFVQSVVNAGLASALAHRDTIEQAKGALMLVYPISADEAFQRLVRRSQNEQVKLRQVAADLVSLLALEPRDEDLVTAAVAAFHPKALNAARLADQTVEK